MRGDTHMDCKAALPLVPSYLDGELSEAQAAPLRKHLLACQPCRGDAQAQKNLKRWFVPVESAVVPKGFSARVARAAFAGAAVSAAANRPEPVAEERDMIVPAARRPLASAALSPALSTGKSRENGELFPFVLRLTVAAAVLALLASVAIRSLTLPGGAELRADDRPALDLDQALERLDEIERAEARGAATTVAGESRTDPQRP